MKAPQEWQVKIEAGMNIEIWHVALATALLLNLIVTVLLVKSDELDAFQKGAQIILVWIIPFIGAIGLWLFNHSQSQSPKQTKLFGGGPRDSSNAGSAGE